MVAKTQTNRREFSGSDLELIMGCRLCSSFGRVHRRHISIQHKSMESILHPRTLVWLPKEFFGVCVVIGEQDLGRAIGDEPTLPKQRMLGNYNWIPIVVSDPLHRGAWRRVAP